MASIIPHGGKYRAVVRKRGYKPQTKVFDRKADAVKWAKGVEAQMDGGSYLAQSKLTGVQLCERFRDEVAPHRKGFHSELVRLKRFIRDIHFLQKPVASITDDDLRTWRNKRQKQVQSATVRRELSCLSGVFTHAIKEWGVKMRVNPCSLIKWPQSGPSRTRRPGFEELDALIEYYDFDISRPPCTGRGHAKQAVIWILLLAVETAMRLSEIATIKIENVHLDEKWVYLPETKNSDARQVPMTPFAHELFRALLSAPRHAPKPKPKRDWSKYHAAKEGRHAGPQAGAVPAYQKDYSDRLFAVSGGVIGEYYRKTCKELGIANLHFHDMRHEATTRLAENFDLLPLSKITGHRDPKNLMIYYNPTAQELAAHLHRPENASAKFMTKELIKRVKKTTEEKT